MSVCRVLHVFNQPLVIFLVVSSLSHVQSFHFDDDPDDLK